MIINQFWLKLAAWTVAKPGLRSPFVSEVRGQHKVSWHLLSDLAEKCQNSREVSWFPISWISAAALSPDHQPKHCRGKKAAGSWSSQPGWAQSNRLESCRLPFPLGAVLVQTFNPLHLSAISKGFVLNPFNSNKTKQDFGDLFLVFLPPHFALLL